MRYHINICLFLILMGLSVVSCSNEREFEIVIVNDTAFNLDRIKIGCGEGAYFAQAPSQGSSNPFFITLEDKGLSLAEPLLCISILQYSTAARTYEYSFGSVISISSLEEKRINYIRVEQNEDPDPAEFIFTIKLQ